MIRRDPTDLFLDSGWMRTSLDVRRNNKMPVEQRSEAVKVVLVKLVTPSPSYVTILFIFESRATSKPPTKTHGQD